MAHEILKQQWRVDVQPVGRTLLKRLEEENVPDGSGRQRATTTRPSHETERAGVGLICLCLSLSLLWGPFFLPLLILSLPVLYCALASPSPLFFLPFSFNPEESRCPANSAARSRPVRGLACPLGCLVHWRGWSRWSIVILSGFVTATQPQPATSVLLWLRIAATEIFVSHAPKDSANINRSAPFQPLQLCSYTRARSAGASPELTYPAML